MKLSVQKRTLFGKKVKSLKKQSLVPGIVYGKHVDTPIPVAFDRVQLVKAIQKAGKNTPVELQWDGIDELVLFHDIQLHPVTDRVIHVDCLGVNKNELVHAEVPVVLVGESPFEKNGLWRVQLLRNTLEVEALPMDLPADIKIDVSSLTDDGMVLHISDITVWDKVTLIGDAELTVLSTVAFKTETEEAVEATEEDQEGEWGEKKEGEESTEEKKE